MGSLNDEEFKKAFEIWYRSYHFQDVDEFLLPFTKLEILPSKLKTNNQLQQIRNSLFLSSESVARELQISRASYAKIEENERRGVISLKTLTRAAAAMECEIQYVIRPENGKLPSHIIWRKLYATLENHPWIQACNPRMRPEALNYLIERRMNEPGFRRKNNWSERANRNF